MQCIKGIVIHGKGEGRLLGYPTANLDAPADEFETGIYAGYAQIHGASSKFPTAIIVREVDNTVRMEAHVLDWEQDLYGRAISVCPIKRMRDWKNFDTTEELQKQIVQDLREIRVILGL